MAILLCLKVVTFNERVISEQSWSLAVDINFYYRYFPKTVFSKRVLYYNYDILIVITNAIQKSTVSYICIELKT